jgi:hypothetical protein
MKARQLQAFRGKSRQIAGYRECLAGAGGFEPRYGELELALSAVREEPQNLFSLKFIGPSKRWNFENRTESAESRASEINGPFGE